MRFRLPVHNIMSFDSLFAAPSSTPAGAEPATVPVTRPSGFSEFFASGTPAEVTQAQKVANLASEQQVSAANAQHANSFTGILKGTFSDLAAPFVEGYQQAAAQVKQKSFSPGAAASAVTESFGSALQDAGDKVYEAARSLGDSHTTLLQKGVNVGEAALSTFGPIFAGLTAPLTYASSLPGIGPVADKVNEIFSALGSGASKYATTALVDNLPVSDQTKNTIRPLVGDIAALSAQLALGKVGGDALGKIAEHGKGILTAVGDDVKTNPQHIEALNAATAENASSQTPVGGVPRETTPVTPPESAPAAPGSTFLSQFDTTAQEGTRAPLQPVESTGETLPSRLAANVEANAIEKKLTSGLGDLPQYNRVDLKEQALHAADLIATDPARAMRIALGQELPPNHILPEAVFTAVEDRAVKAGDANTLRRLATESTLSTEATAMGQRIRALGERDQESPVKLIQDVQKSRVDSVEKKTGKKVAASTKEEVSSINDEIRSSAKTARPSWEEFVQQLSCNT